MTDRFAVTGESEEIPNLSALGAITAEYQHYDKHVESGADLSLPGAYLKWYDIHRTPAGMPPALIQESRAYLLAEATTGNLRFTNQLGFIELHHCVTVAFLLVCSWNNDNELWMAQYVKDLENGGGFRPVEMREGASRPIYCVWELAPVWHERQAWRRYLCSARDEDAQRAYLADRFTGPC